jgi:hypothetical protein
MRQLVAGSMLVALAFSAGALHANEWDEFWHRCKVDFHRNNAWPEPFVTADRAAVRAPFCLMVDNGWKMQNTVGTYLYDPSTQRLNQAGEHLVKWIVQQAPRHRRVVFVLKGDTPEATAARIESVQLAVAKYACGGEMPPVVPTMTEPTGWPAQYVDQMTQQYQATIPAPRLPAAADGGEGSGESGGASQ